MGQRRNSLLSIAIAVAICSMAASSLAAPFVAHDGRARKAYTYVEKVHGFHCRSELGWDPVSGAYRRHNHPGICRDYYGCLKEHQRCIFVLGRGFESWQYERWGSDNWRYTSCMIRNGCY